MTKKLSKAQQIKHDEEYLEFLKKRLDSKNYKSNVNEEEFNKTKEKYEKLKLKLRFLKAC